MLDLITYSTYMYHFFNSNLKKTGKTTNYNLYFTRKTNQIRSSFKNLMQSLYGGRGEDGCSEGVGRRAGEKIQQRKK